MQGVSIQVAPAAGGIGGSTGAADNRLLRSDGTGGATLQASAITVDDDGDITSFGGQLGFPATQNASADANTLDDYEEGTWTPALAIGGSTTGITYTSRSGTYRKAGQIVEATHSVVLSSKGGLTGAATVTGLPFTAGSGASQWSGVAVVMGGTWGSLVSGVNGSIAASGTTIALQAPTTTGDTPAGGVNMTNTSQWSMTIIYEASA